MAENEDTLRGLDEAIKRGRELLDQGHDRQDELNDLLSKLDELQAQAKKDVELTKATLKDANEIYKTLKGNNSFNYLLIYKCFARPGPDFPIV